MGDADMCLKLVCYLFNHEFLHIDCLAESPHLHGLLCIIAALYHLQPGHSTQPEMGILHLHSDHQGQQGIQPLQPRLPQHQNQGLKVPQKHRQGSVLLDLAQL